MMTARELMTESPQVVDATATLQSALEKLHALDVRHLPVVDSDGALVGMLSDRDLRASMFALPLDASVSSIMTSDVIAVDEEADASEVIELMLDNKIGAVPVIDADETLVGIISYVDILRNISESPLTVRFRPGVPIGSR
jgi:acetoin utilization protein AcuB